MIAKVFIAARGQEAYADHSRLATLTAEARDGTGEWGGGGRRGEQQGDATWESELMRHQLCDSSCVWVLLINTGKLWYSYNKPVSQTQILLLGRTFMKAGVGGWTTKQAGRHLCWTGLLLFKEQYYNWMWVTSSKTDTASAITIKKWI